MNSDKAKGFLNESRNCKGMDAAIKYQAVIFDLDGTLLDTLEDLADSMNAVLEEMQFPTHKPDSYRYFVGEGMRTLAKRVLPVGCQDEARIDLVVQRMSSEYDKRWKVKSRPYPGIEEVLGSLTEFGLSIAVLSNKPDAFTQVMVPALLPGWQFSQVVGARAGVPVKPDPQAALEIAAKLGLSPERILYVGDTATDMLTANAAGMVAVGVAWGFRPVEELLEHGAKSIIGYPGELMDLVRDKP